MSDFAYIRSYYGVPAKRGARVEYQGKPGTVTGTSGPHVMVKLDGGKHALPYHPTDLRWADAAPDGGVLEGTNRTTSGAVGQP